MVEPDRTVRHRAQRPFEQVQVVAPSRGWTRERKLRALAQPVPAIHLADKSRVFDTARIEALEVQNLIAAQATMESAASRRECRGAHVVEDYERGVDDPEFPLGRNDRDWLKHTLRFQEGNRIDYQPVNLKPLTVESISPRVRTF